MEYILLFKLSTMVIFIFILHNIALSSPKLNLNYTVANEMRII